MFSEQFPSVYKGHCYHRLSQLSFSPKQHMLNDLNLSTLKPVSYRHLVKALFLTA